MSSRTRLRAARPLHVAIVVLLLVIGIPAWTPSVAPISAQSCREEQELNDQPENALEVGGAFCIEGTLPGGDQDFFLWTVEEADIQRRWTIAIDGIPDTLTAVKIFRVESLSDITPAVLGNELLDISTSPEQSSRIAADLLFPTGVFLLGVTRSETASGISPVSEAYTLTVSPGAPLPPAGDQEPNDDPSTAAPIEGMFSLSGDLRESEDWYAWTLSEADAVKGWELRAQVGIGQPGTLELQDSDGRSLTTLSPGADGRATLYDLGLSAATYYVRIGPSSDEAAVYLLEAVGVGERPAHDIEPNETIADASSLDPAQPVATGRLAREGDSDFYLLTVDAELAATLFDLKLIWRSERNRSLCLTDAAGLEIQCRSGRAGVALTNVLLSPGDYGIRVSGEADLEDPYLLRLDRTAAPDPGFESEPNESVSDASPMQPGQPVHGRLTGDDRDYFRLTVSGEPQLWLAEVDGTGITKLGVYNAAGSELAIGEVTGTGARAQLSDLFLTPGDHWFAVTGADGEYTLQLTPIGPPDPNAEREPNNTPITANILTLGQPRTGRLVERSDADFYRFSLAAPEHVAIRIEPPDDGAVRFSLRWGRDTLAQTNLLQPGQATTYDGMLLAGDYLLVLQPEVPSEGHYTVAIDRLDPFAIAVDQEPNNSFYQARPLPPSLTIEGTVGEFRDDDWFALPDFDAPTRATITLEEGRVSIEVSDGANALPLTPDETGGAWTAEIPAATPLALRVSGQAEPYRLSVAFADGPNPQADPPALDVELDLSSSTTDVAAYIVESQRVDAELTLTNTGTASRDLTLDAVTSHYAWTVELGESDVTIDAAATVTVPVVVVAGPDAWADHPVRITVRARDETGVQETAFVEITPGRESPVVNSGSPWTVPEVLLGGLDVASLALGASPLGTVDPDHEAQLHDGHSPSGGGFNQQPTSLPLELTVDLAGDDAIPVAGIVLNPQGGDGHPQDQVRGFALLLSEDGVDFAEVLTGELGPLTIDQPFVLDDRVPARFARLRIDSTYSSTPANPGRVILGEWKVIALPGAVPEPASPFNLADPAKGGHVVWIDPQDYGYDFARSMLIEESDRRALTVEAGRQPQWVIGFEDNRAAQITELQWVDPPDSIPETRFGRVAVAVSTTSPIGTWADLGTWELARGSDGTVAPLALDAPVWARFVRFTGDGPTEGATWEYPATIRILERPTDAEYRSILGEWGQDTPAGPFEALNPSAPDTERGEAGEDETPDQARPLPLHETVRDTVQSGRDVDWFRVVIPSDRDTLLLAVTGEPTVGVTVALFDEEGDEVPLRAGERDGPGRAGLLADVVPGQTYLVRVEQPPHSVVLAFDTSMSLAGYQPFVFGAMQAFVAGVTPGEAFANIMPFEDSFLLDEWTDQPYLLQSALNAYVDQSLSSSAEQTILDATAALASRPGAKAIVLVTDAETSSYQTSAEMWQMMVIAQPRIFAVHIGAGADPAWEQDLMQDWASIASGYYGYARVQGEVDRAFDRAATWLLRPASYSLTAATMLSAPPPTPTPMPTPTPAPTATPEPTATPAEPISPGSIQVMPAVEAGDLVDAPIAAGIAVEIILDTSGSMLQELEPGRTRADIAKEVLSDLVTTTLPPGAPVALRVFGAEPNSCDTDLAVPLQPLDPSSMAQVIDDLPIVNLVRTPLGASLDAVATDLGNVPGPKIVVLVTDGEETCDGDPLGAIENLVAQGYDVHVNIVGFALDDEALKAEFERWAEVGNGRYIDAGNAEELNDAIQEAVAPPYQILDANGDVIATGVVGGAAVELPPGVYAVEVLSDPVQRLEGVVVEPDRPTTVQLE